MLNKNTIENIYFTLLDYFTLIKDFLYFLTRRITRFLSLPYCYFYLINWNKCNKNKLLVIYDLFYIYYVLKYFPDNYSSCRLYEKSKEDWPYYYGSIYNPYPRKKLQKQVQHPLYDIIFNDKILCNDICTAYDLPMPKLLGVLYPNEQLDLQINNILRNNPDMKKCIIKPYDGQGGTEVYLIVNKKNKYCIYKNNKEYSVNNLNINKKYILQEYILQHKYLNEISKSVNTIRIVTLVTKDNNILILGNYMRFGIGDSITDNLSQNGIRVGIDKKNGRLNNTGTDRLGNVLEKHPTSNKYFKNFQVPYWDEVVNLAKFTQFKFQNFYALLGLDVAITEYGPVIIEINPDYDNIGLEAACGPIFKNSEVLKAFKDHNLLYNHKQKSLLNI